MLTHPGGTYMYRYLVCECVCRSVSVCWFWHMTLCLSVCLRICVRGEWELWYRLWLCLITYQSWAL